MSDLRVAVVGYGYQGREHGGLLRAGVAGAVPAAVVDRTCATGAIIDGLPAFASLDDLLAARAADAVVIATPHAAHAGLAIAALRAGLHVLIEKPVAIAARDVDTVLAVHARHPGQVLAAVHQQRCDPRYQRLRALIRSGALGAIHRVTWTVTDWYRSESYYRQAPWRGTWAGEGGGVLVNQAVHQLDLWCWLFGRPERVQARCRFGAWHGIEAEDDVTCLLELPGGGSGVFIASTGDSPGVNRLEIACDRGQVEVDGEGIRFRRTRVAVCEHRRTSASPWDHPANEDLRYPDTAPAAPLRPLVEDFVAACRSGGAPLAPVAEARDQVELANAMLVSAVDGSAVDLPLAAERFPRVLAGLAEAVAVPA